jgi:hypothetical protein
MYKHHRTEKEKIIQSIIASVFSFMSIVLAIIAVTVILQIITRS